MISKSKSFRKLLPFFALLVGCFFSGCDELKHLSHQALGDRPLTQEEVVRGLKEALRIGSDSAASKLSAVNGYYGDALVKILLPPEAEVITRNLSMLPGGDKLVEEVVLRINRAAEDAAGEVAPIFAGAIMNMTIADGFAILRGEKDAATKYLHGQTYDALSSLVQPKIGESVRKPIVGNISTADAWNTLTGKWNEIAGSLPGRLANLQPVYVDLESYLTGKALDGLFLKLAIEEEKIRTEPMARVTELLLRVFGSQSGA